MSEDESVDARADLNTTAINRMGSQPEARRMRAIDIARKIRSFDHFLFVWGEKGKYYMPPRRCITWEYIAQVLAKEKRLVKAEKVGNQIQIPKTRGIVVKDLFGKFKDTNDFGNYFPDVTSGRSIPREYFFNVMKVVLLEVFEQFLKSLNENAKRKSRVSKQAEITVSEEAQRMLSLLTESETLFLHRRDRDETIIGKYLVRNLLDDYSNSKQRATGPFPPAPRRPKP